MEFQSARKIWGGGGGSAPPSPVHLWQQLPFLLLIQSLEFYTRTYRLMLSVQVLDGYENQRKNQTRWWTFLKSFAEVITSEGKTTH